MFIPKVRIKFDSHLVVFEVIGLDQNGGGAALAKIFCKVIADNIHILVQIKFVRPMALNARIEVESMAPLILREITKPSHHLFSIVF